MWKYQRLENVQIRKWENVQIGKWENVQIEPRWKCQRLENVQIWISAVCSLQNLDIAIFSLTFNFCCCYFLQYTLDRIYLHIMDIYLYHIARLWWGAPGGRSAPPWPWRRRCSPSSTSSPSFLFHSWYGCILMSLYILWHFNISNMCYDFNLR